MTVAQSKILSVFAPSKINLYLHVTGRRDNGYHELDSLVAFVDIGDQIKITPASEFSFEIKGPYARAFTAKERDSSPNSANLVVRAVWSLAQALQREPNVKVTLTKNLPLAAGLGGGSSDAATVLWGLMEWWGFSIKNLSYLDDLLISLGADVPACFHCQATHMSGIGEILNPLRETHMPELPIILVNPNKFCPTAKIFSHFDTDFVSGTELPDDLGDIDALMNFLSVQKNMLTEAATTVVPEISDILDVLKGQKGCQMARMTGSGPTCFAIFENEEQALTVTEKMLINHPEWWIKHGTLNRPERY